MSKDKKFFDAGKNVASGIFQKRQDYVETHKEEEVFIDEAVEEKRLISSDNFGTSIMSDDANKQLGLESNTQIPTAVLAEAKLKALTKKEIEENQRIENEKVDILAGIMTRGGELKPSLMAEDEPEEVLMQQEEEEEEIDYSYNVTSQFYTQAVKPIDRSPKNKDKRS